MICGVCGADFSHPSLDGGRTLLELHQHGEHNGARDLVDIEAMREADALVPTWPPLAPAFGIWSSMPRNRKAIEANERAGLKIAPPRASACGVSQRPAPLALPTHKELGLR